MPFLVIAPVCNYNYTSGKNIISSSADIGYRRFKLNFFGFRINHKHLIVIVAASEVVFYFKIEKFKGINILFSCITSKLIFPFIKLFLFFLKFLLFLFNLFSGSCFFFLLFVFFYFFSYFFFFFFQNFFFFSNCLFLFFQFFLFFSSCFFIFRKNRHFLFLLRFLFFQPFSFFLKIFFLL